jgi:hypothetical protein
LVNRTLANYSLLGISKDILFSKHAMLKNYSYPNAPPKSGGSKKLEVFQRFPVIGSVYSVLETGGGLRGTAAT